MYQTDLVIDLAWGDSGKGKVSHSLLSNQSYDLVLRTSGANNCGHTIYHGGKKYATHSLPAGIFRGIPSVIGRNCALHPRSFFQELDKLSAAFAQDAELSKYDLRQLVKVDGRTTIITDAHLAEDAQDTKIGTTKKGVGPAVRDKYGRTGQQAQDVPELQPFLIDLVQELGRGQIQRILGEGAQGHFLDPHFGTMPYVTSLHCGTAAALLNGLSHKSLHRVYGCIKAYTTYVGNDSFHGTDPILNQIQEVGQEYGTTTGRKRQCNYLNLEDLAQAILVNSPDILVISKMDVLQRVDTWKFISRDGAVENVHSEENFKERILTCLHTLDPQLTVKFSYRPDDLTV